MCVLTIWTRSLTVPAKPVGNLSLRMFQRYFARMADALKACPGVVANDLYSSHLIARETVDKVQPDIRAHSSRESHYFAHGC